MDRETRRALRLLQAYAGITTTLLVALSLAAFRQAGGRRRLGVQW